MLYNKLIYIFQMLLKKINKCKEFLICFYSSDTNLLYVCAFE